MDAASTLKHQACGNAVIDAPVENLMDRQAAHRFTTGAWKSPRGLSHNHLDNSQTSPHRLEKQFDSP